MKFRDFLHDYAFFWGGYLFFLILFFLFFWQLHVEFSFLLLFLICFGGFGLFSFLVLFWKRKKFYDSFFHLLDSLDQKYLITEMEIVPPFLEAKQMMDALYEIDKSFKEYLVSFETRTNDFKDFIELWIHEVKIPLSNLTLLVHNQSYEEEKMKEQLIRLDSYVEQVLFFVRSETVEKDYLIHKCSMKEMVHEVIKKNKDAFILQHISLSIDVHHFVYTDEKWMIFILNQILSNSLKYRKEKNAKISIRSYETEDLICLEIWDNGRGILESDLPRVFEKSFTGENGRECSSSTGMGLYIVKNLIDKLGHHITISSLPSKYTQVTISFSKTDFYQVVE